MDPITVSPTPEEVVAQVSDDAALLPVATTTQPADPQPSAADLAKLAQTGDGNPVVVLGLALLAVVGGGSAWKLWTKRSEQAHELAMKRLELDAATMNGTAQPPPCQAKQAETEARLVSMEARLAKTERASAGLPNGFDADELDSRIGKLEAQMKKMGVKPPTKGGAK